jgi:hypothetical protein
LAGIFGFVDRAHFGASKHATLGSTIPPAIDGSHGAAVILCPAELTDVDLAASTAARGSVRLYIAK